jgi:hypothetical protein
MKESERIIWKYYNFNYSPLFLFGKIKDAFIKLKNFKAFTSKDNLDIPFTSDQIALFLEACVSLVFFLYKNKISKQDLFKHFSELNDEVRIESYVLIKRIKGFNCINSMLSFSPGNFEGKDEIILDVYLKNVSRDDIVFDESSYNIPLSITKRDFRLECYTGPFDEEEVKKFMYYPRNIGYDITRKNVILKNFKISKEIKKEDYPLYVNVLYVKDYIEYEFSRS